MITLLSYPQGCSGDFVALQIHKNPGYLDIKLEPNTVNRYELPCLTKKVWGWDVKCTNKIITPDRIQQLKQAYGDRDLILPTHSFRAVYTDALNFARLYTRNTDIIRLSYAMWLYKSHAIMEPPWEERWEQIKSIPEPARTELITRFHKWKYLCYWGWGKFMDSNTFDLGKYIRGYYDVYEQQCNLTFKKEPRDGYAYFDVAELVYNANTTELEEYLNIDLDQNSFKNYADANYQLLKDKSVDLYSDHFFEQLTLSLEDSMMQTIDLTHYDP